MKSFRFLFDKGINVVQDKAILGDGWTTVSDNVDLRSGMPRALKGPVEIETVATGFNRLFEYRGKFHLSALYRDYVAEFVDGIERIYYTEYGESPRKIISGTDAALGTLYPQAAPTVATTKQLVPGTLTLTQSLGGSLAKGLRSYRVAAETPDGIQSPSGKVVVNIAADNSQVALSWTSVFGAVSYHIFGGVEDDEREIKEVPSTYVTWTDTGAYPPSGDFASSYITTNPYTYIYTFVRDVKSVQDESGPSTASYPITTTYGRRVSFDILNDGYFGQAEAVAITGGISYTPSGLSPIGISGYEYNSSLLQVKFTTLSPHGFSTFDKVYFTNLYDSNWTGQTLPVIADLTDTSVFYVKNMPMPDPTTTATVVTGGPFSVGSIYTVTNVGTTTDWAALGATGVTGTVFKAATTGGTGDGVATQSAACYPARTVIDIGATGPTATDCMYVKYNGSGSTYKAQSVTGTTVSVDLLSASGGTVSEVRYIPNNNYYKYRNLYRTGDAGGYFLVKQLDIWEPYYDDGISVTNLGNPPDSFYQQNGVEVFFEPPPKGMQSLVSHYGMLFAIEGYNVRWTPIGKQDAWPENFNQTFPYKPIALASFAQGLIVLCEDALYRLDGNDPTRLSLSKTRAENGCVAPHTVQKTHAGLLYLSKRGVMLFDGMDARCITDQRITPRFLFGPSSLSTDIDYWWHPTLWGYNYANLCTQDGISTEVVNAYPLENTVPISGIQNDLRSFYHLGKYYLYWTASSNYEANTCIVIDLQVEGFPITTMGMKIVDACVNELEQVFVLTPDYQVVPPYVPITWSGVPYAYFVGYKNMPGGDGPGCSLPFQVTVSGGVTGDILSWSASLDSITFCDGLALSMTTTPLSDTMSFAAVEGGSGIMTTIDRLVDIGFIEIDPTKSYSPFGNLNLSVSDGTTTLSETVILGLMP